VRHPRAKGLGSLLGPTVLTDCLAKRGNMLRDSGPFGISTYELYWRFELVRAPDF
jgi:hypothetical protein